MRGLTKWFRDRSRSGGTRGWGATEEEWKPWGTRAVTHADGSGKLNTRKYDPAVKGRTIHDCERENLQVSRTETATCSKRRLGLDNFVDTIISRV